MGTSASFFNNSKEKGLYGPLFSSSGASPPTQRTDFRLGEFGLETPPPPGPPPEVPLFERDVAGIPLWLFAVAFLGFAFARRSKKKKSKQSSPI
jgi:hypothetical protein